ncbi:hypothetical protein TNCT_653021 [Trichonephila clavata]|uniref:Uncharacterized protein n=1 Tax=Trichonephila clavata TaxID=2740835 RepID=A0A8X6G109_TRICU|nr:hypothetical protein TNCT_653021 [Trichonephila clavata]
MGLCKSMGPDLLTGADCLMWSFLWHSIQLTVVHVPINDLASQEGFLMVQGLGGPPTGGENFLCMEIWFEDLFRRLYSYIHWCFALEIMQQLFFNHSQDTVQERGALTLCYCIDLRVSRCCKLYSFFRSVRILAVLLLTLIGPRLSAINGPHFTALDDWLQIYGQSRYRRYKTRLTIYGLSANLCPQPMLS